MTADYRFRPGQRIKQLFNGKWRIGTVVTVEKKCITVSWDALPGHMKVIGDYKNDQYKYFRSCVKSER